ncbi:MAG TPA: hypothetical protein DD477_05415 [Spirochaetaceae bacterium]|nr:hypothetical protein [Spirochaetaceae bacterium]
MPDMVRIQLGLAGNWRLVSDRTSKLSERRRSSASLKRNSWLELLRMVTRTMMSLCGEYRLRSKNWMDSWTCANRLPPTSIRTSRLIIILRAGTDRLLVCRVAFVYYGGRARAGALLPVTSHNKSPGIGQPLLLDYYRYIT